MDILHIMEKRQSQMTKNWCRTGELFGFNLSWHSTIRISTQFFLATTHETFSLALWWFLPHQKSECSVVCSIAKLRNEWKNTWFSLFLSVTVLRWRLDWLACLHEGSLVIEESMSNWVIAFVVVILGMGILWGFSRSSYTQVQVSSCTGSWA